MKKGTHTDNGKAAAKSMPLKPTNSSKRKASTKNVRPQSK
jgi:hypothetical protein